VVTFGIVSEICREQPGVLQSVQPSVYCRPGTVALGDNLAGRLCVVTEDSTDFLSMVIVKEIDECLWRYRL